VISTPTEARLVTTPSNSKPASPKNALPLKSPQSKTLFLNPNFFGVLPLAYLHTTGFNDEKLFSELSRLASSAGLDLSYRLDPSGFRVYRIPISQLDLLETWDEHFFLIAFPDSEEMFPIEFLASNHQSEFDQNASLWKPHQETTPLKDLISCNLTCDGNFSPCSSMTDEERQINHKLLDEIKSLCVQLQALHNSVCERNLKKPLPRMCTSDCSMMTPEEHELSHQLFEVFCTISSQLRAISRAAVGRYRQFNPKSTPGQVKTSVSSVKIKPPSAETPVEILEIINTTIAEIADLELKLLDTPGDRDLQIQLQAKKKMLKLLRK
jgi:hypothetical protein